MGCAYRRNPEGLIAQTAAKISEVEVRDLLDGRLPDGTEIPVCPFEEFKRGIADLPMRYGVILDFELAKSAKRGYESFDVLRNEANMIVRAGGVEPLAAYLDRFRDRHNTKLMGNWHPYVRIDPDQPQTRMTLCWCDKSNRAVAMLKVVPISKTGDPSTRLVHVFKRL